VNYYNECDKYCAAWLQNLMDAGHIPAGHIDTRSIEDVTPDELRGALEAPGCWIEIEVIG
jgi:DNA (cytosine-5)-methyltransferase 1